MNFKDRLVIALGLFVILGAVLGGYTREAWSETRGKYPERNITISITYGPGSGNDLTARALALAMKAEGLLPPGVEILIVNENIGGSSAIGVTKYATTVKDPYKILAVPRTMLVNKVRGTTKYGWRDLTPLAQIVSSSNGIAVSTKSKYKSLKELIEALRKDPTSVTWIGRGPPGSDWMAWAGLMMTAGIASEKVYFASVPRDGDAMSAVLGGHADAWTAAPEDVSGQVKAGNLRLLGVSSAQRVPQYPDVPTYSEVIGKECVFGNWRAYFGPKQMPEDAVKWWAETLKKLDKTESWKIEMAKISATRALLTTDDFAKMLGNDEDRAHKLLKMAGLVK